MRRFQKKLLISGMMFIFTLGMLTGCGKHAGAGDNSKEKDSDKDVELNIMLWDQDYDESVFKAFEKKTGIHVNINYIDNTDTIISKL